MDEIIVHKFGGSCLRESGDIDRIFEVLNESTGTPIVVVSALWGMTDILLRAAREPRYAGRLVEDLRSQHLRFAPGLESGQFGELFVKVLDGISKELVKLSSEEKSLRSENLILAAGERLSALVVAHRLCEAGLNAHPVGAEDIGLRLKGSGRATQIDIESSDLWLNRAVLVGVPILTGWFGQGDDGEIAILSRGGSDHSAAAFANLMDAKKIILWKDVDGIKELNPRWGIDTKSIPYLGYGEAAELSRHGTPVIHPATVIPLQKKGIPLEIRNITRPNQPTSTMVGPDLSISSIKAIGCQPGVAVINSNAPLHSDLLSRLETADVTAWSLNSTPEQMRLIIPSSEFYLIEDLVDGTIEHHSAMLSIIGPITGIIECTHEIISTNEFGTRVIIDCDDIPAMLENLHHSLFSRQDCK